MTNSTSPMISDKASALLIRGMFSSTRSAHTHTSQPTHQLERGRGRTPDEYAAAPEASPQPPPTWQRWPLLLVRHAVVHKHHGHRGGDDGQEEVRYCDNLQTCMSKHTFSCEA
jgi:hypothetical protein